MKFVKHVAVLAAASALFLTAGVSAASANTDTVTGYEGGAPGAPVAATPGSVWVSNFSAAPSADGFNMSFSYLQSVWSGEGELKLGIYDAATQAPFDASTLATLGLGLVEQAPEITRQMADLSAEVYGQATTTLGRVDKALPFKATGAYTVMLFEVNSVGTRFLGGAEVNLIAATPIAPAFTAATSTLVVPESAEFSYQDESGETWAPGSYVLTKPVKLAATPNPGYVLANGAVAEWPVFAPATKPAPDKKPDTGNTPDNGKNQNDGNGKDSSNNKPPVTEGKTPAPEAPNESQLSPELEGKVKAQETAVAGAQVKIFVGTQYAGTEVDVYVFSEPTYLGRHKVDADGNVSVTLPAGFTGSHRLAVFNGSELIGWNRIVISDSADGSTETGFVPGTVTTSKLATTGSGSTETIALLAIGSVAAGAIGLMARRRTRRTAA